MSGRFISSSVGPSLAERWRLSQLETIRAKAEESSDLARPGGDITPARCPSCRSAEIVTNARVATADSYWRCLACGEMWNAGRLRLVSRRGGDHGFRR
jgi:predicted Zn finger-like uncharacterized protein